MVPIVNTPSRQEGWDVSAENGKATAEESTPGQRLEAVIREELARLRITVEVCAKAANLTRGTIYGWFGAKDGHRGPRSDSLVAVARVLGIPASRLLNAYQGIEEPVLPADAVQAAADQVTDAIKRATSVMEDVRDLLQLQPKPREVRLAGPPKRRGHAAEQAAPRMAQTPRSNGRGKAPRSGDNGPGQTWRPGSP